LIPNKSATRQTSNRGKTSDVSRSNIAFSRETHHKSASLRSKTKRSFCNDGEQVTKSTTREDSAASNSTIVSYSCWFRFFSTTLPIASKTIRQGFKKVPLILSQQIVVASPFTQVATSTTNKKSGGSGGGAGGREENENMQRGAKGKENLDSGASMDLAEADSAGRTD